MQERQEDCRRRAPESDEELQIILHIRCSQLDVVGKRICPTPAADHYSSRSEGRSGLDQFRIELQQLLQLIEHFRLGRARIPTNE